ncbi:hypothetical protein [uncultured Nostoc sp.]
MVSAAIEAAKLVKATLGEEETVNLSNGANKSRLDAALKLLEIVFSKSS